MEKLLCDGLISESGKKIIPLGFASGIIPNSRRLLDSSTYSENIASLMFRGSHYDRQVSVHFVSETWVSLPPLMRDNSTNQFQDAMLLKLESH
jgi:hypothetical protein